MSRLVGILKCYKGQKTIYMDRRNIIKSMFCITAFNFALAYFGNLEQVDQSRTSRPISEKESWIEIRCTCTLQRKNITINNFSLPNLATFLINWFPCLFAGSLVCLSIWKHFISIFLLFLLR